jgi:hypothetical protein
MNIDTLLNKYISLDSDMRKNSELEVRFNTSNSSHFKINRNEYEQVLKRLKSVGYVFTDSYHILKIMSDKNDTDINQNMKMELHNINTIQAFCKEKENLNIDEYKKYIRYNYKNKKNVNNSNNLIYVNNSFDFNVTLSTDIVINHEDYENTITDKENNINNVIHSEIKKWTEHFKNKQTNSNDGKINYGSFSNKKYRYLNRISGIHSSTLKNVKIDMSIVETYHDNSLFDKSTLNKTQSDRNQTNTISYEIEIEYVNHDKQIIISQESKYIKYVINTILCGIQNTNYPISYDKIEEVRDSYLQVVLNENDYKKYIDILNQNKKTYGKYKRNIKYTNYFIGPSSVSLEKKHFENNINENVNGNVLEQNVSELKRNVINDRISNNVSIYNYYTITDKADGLRKLLFIYHVKDKNRKYTNTYELYYITTSLKIEYTGITLNVKDINETYQIKELGNTIIDGEYIETDKENNKIDLYKAFDIYFVNNKDIRPNNFIKLNDTIDKDKKGRYELLNEVIKSINEVKIQIKPFYMLFVDENDEVKDSIKNQHIKKQVIKLDSEMKNFVYNTDGFIFTPAFEPIPDTIKFKKTWNKSLKWKPPEYNTIDFLVRESSSKIHSKIMNNSNISYRQYYLYVGGKNNMNMSSFEKIANISTQNTRLYSNQNNNYTNILFKPENYATPESHIYNGIIDDDGNIFTEETHERIEDDSIIECRYNMKGEDGFKWVPIRIRHDKTYEYRINKSNFGNDIKTATNVWNTIHEPISLKLLKDPSKILKSLNIETDNDYNHLYYNRSKNKILKTNELRKFHNFVKNILIKKVTDNIRKTSQDKNNITLLDFAVGKAGDLEKWKNSGIKFVLGIDLYDDNIHNKYDGAYKRYLDNIINKKKRYNDNDNDNKILDCLFVQGDSSIKILSNNINISNKAIDNKILEYILHDTNNEQILNQKMNMNNMDDKLLNYVYDKYSKYKNSKFNIISIQFALHYFFETKEKLNNLLDNIDNHIQIGGYFIGTGYNGGRIYNKFKELSSNVLFKPENKKDDENIYWKIEKEYEETSELDDLFINNRINGKSINENNVRNIDNCFGLSIKVYQDSINQTLKEYLIHFKYLDEIMKSRGYEKVYIDNLNSLNGGTSLETKNIPIEERINIESVINYNFKYFKNELVKNMNVDIKNVDKDYRYIINEIQKKNKDKKMNKLYLNEFLDNSKKVQDINIQTNIDDQIEISNYNDFFIYKKIRNISKDTNTNNNLNNSKIISENSIISSDEKDKRINNKLEQIQDAGERLNKNNLSEIYNEQRWESCLKFIEKKSSFNASHFKTHIEGMLNTNTNNSIKDVDIYKSYIQTDNYKKSIGNNGIKSNKKQKSHPLIQQLIKLEKSTKKTTKISSIIKSYLDFGCGNGELIMNIKEHLDTKNIYGADIKKYNGIEENKIPFLNVKNLIVDKINNTNIDLTDSIKINELIEDIIKGIDKETNNTRFDLITLYMVLHHISDKYLNIIIKVLTNLLSEKGRMVLKEHDSPSIESVSETNNEKILFKKIIDSVHDVYDYAIDNNDLHWDNIDDKLEYVSDYRSRNEWEQMMNSNNLSRVEITNSNNIDKININPQRIYNDIYVKLPK